MPDQGYLFSEPQASSSAPTALQPHGKPVYSAFGSTWAVVATGWSALAKSG